MEGERQMKDGLRRMDGCGFGIGQLPTLARQSRRTLFFEQGACRIFAQAAPPPPCLAHSRSRGLAKWRASMHKRQIGREGIATGADFWTSGGDGDSGHVRQGRKRPKKYDLLR